MARDRGMRGFVGQLGVQVPDRQFHGGHGAGAVAMPARLFVAHGRRRHPGRVEGIARLVQQRRRIGRQDARDHAVAQYAALGEAADGVEGIAHHWPAVAHGIRPTATSDTVCWEKLTSALAILPASGTVTSWMAVIRMMMDWVPDVDTAGRAQRWPARGGASRWSRLIP